MEGTYYQNPTFPTNQSNYEVNMNNNNKNANDYGRKLFATILKEQARLEALDAKLNPDYKMFDTKYSEQYTNPFVEDELKKESSTQKDEVIKV